MPYREIVHTLFGRTILDQNLLTIDQKGLSPVSGRLGNRRLTSAIFNCDATSPRADSYSRSGELPKDDICDPHVFGVIDLDRDP